MPELHMHDWQEVDRIETLGGSVHVAQQCRQCPETREFVWIPVPKAATDAAS